MDDLFSTSPSDERPDETAESEQFPSLEKGLAALKEKDYGTAIAHLNAVVQTTTSQTIGLKAQLGLVKAYERLGRGEDAIALCQSLSGNSNRQVREWATQRLAKLTQYLPQSLQSNPSQDSGSEKIFDHNTRGSTFKNRLPSSHSPQTSLEEDGTGFIPLTNTVPQTSLEDDVTGFVPLTNTEADDAPPTPPFNHDDGQTRITVQEVITTLQLDDEVNEAASPPATEEATAMPAEHAASLDSPLEQQQSDSLSAQHPWRQAKRAQKWGPLGPVDLAQLWAVIAGSAIALVVVARAVLQGAIAIINWVFQHMTWPLDLRIYIIYADPIWVVVLGIGALFCLSPWLLDWVLRLSCGAKSMSLSALESVSPEALRVLQRVGRQQRFPVPALRLLPTDAPLLMTYGCLPRFTTLAISQGVLNQVSDDELATLIAGELVHIARWDVAVMSLVTVTAQLPYRVYEFVSVWGDRQSNQVLRLVAAGVAALSYGLFWLLHWTGLWLSRLRVYYSDRFAVEVTGNPNGLTRALLKLAIGLAESGQRQGYTSGLLESMDLLMPLGYRTALTVGSAVAYAPFETLLQWDWSNPYQGWLAVNNAHPTLGDRLHRLAMYARHWRLETELDGPTASKPPLSAAAARLTRRIRLQGAPVWGLGLGVAIALMLWVVAAIADRVGWRELAWMQGDQAILWGCGLMGFSCGTFLRINAFFPDITRTNLHIEPRLPDLLASPDSMPVDSQPIRLQGTLLGRSGTSNLLAQDLTLQSNTGLIKLHYLSNWGPAGNLLLQPAHPQNFVNTAVTVTGWFRRGATPWIDVDTLQSQHGRKLQGGHPIWSTVLATLTALAGTYIIVRGGS